jgi:hypothetical protein
LKNGIDKQGIIQILQKEFEEAPGHLGDIPMQNQSYEMCQVPT